MYHLNYSKKMAGTQGLRTCNLNNFNNYLLPLRDSFSHSWFATVQEVLQADWQEAWHSPQPPFAQDSLRFALLTVLMCSIMLSS